MFYLLTGAAPVAAKSLKMCSMYLDDMYSEVNKKVPFDCEITDHLLTSWRTISFDVFRKNADNEEKATPKCLQYDTEYNRNEPKHMIGEKPLYNRISGVFRNIQWHKTLFQITKAH